MPRPGYVAGEFRDPDAEIRRLAAQAQIVAAEEILAADAVGLPQSGRVLDVGCGSGAAGARLTAAHPALAILGADLDPLLLVHARHVMPVVRARAHELPFASRVVDAVHLRVVLRHLVDPLGALRESVRVTRVGGVVVVIETDDGTLALDPAPDGFERVFAARQALLRARGADGSFGRRLFGLMRAAGLGSIDVRPLAITSAAIGPAAFAAVLLAPFADALPADVCPSSEVARAVEGIRSWSVRDDVFGMTTALVAGGRVRNSV